MDSVPSRFGGHRRQRRRWLIFALYLIGAILMLLAWIAGGLLQAVAAT